MSLEANGMFDGTAEDGKQLLESLLPETGLLDASVTSDAQAGRGPALRYRIAVPLALPQGTAAAGGEAALRLHSLNLGVRSWRKLAGRDCSFPRDPLEGSLDGEPFPLEDHAPGWIEQAGRYIPVRATRIHFGAVAGGRIPAHIELDLGGREATVEAELKIGLVRIDGDITLLASPGPEEALQIAAAFLTLEDYERQVVDGCTVFSPKADA